MGVIVLTGQSRRIGIVHERRTNTLDRVGRHAHPDSAPADEDGPIGVTPSHHFGCGKGKIGLVDTFIGVGADINDLVPLAEMLAEKFLELRSIVIGSDGDLHCDSVVPLRQRADGTAR